MTKMQFIADLVKELFSLSCLVMMIQLISKRVQSPSESVDMNGLSPNQEIQSPCLKQNNLFATP